MSKKKSTSRKLVPMKPVAPALPEDLLTDVRSPIEQARDATARAANSALVLLYWSVGDRIRRDILKEQRADYGKPIVAALSRQLATEDVNKGCDTLTASGRLRRLRDLGLLDMKGKGSATYYVPTDRLLVPRQKGKPKKTTSKAVEKTSTEPTNLTSLPDKLIDLPDKLQEQLEQLGERAETVDVRTVILSLCGWRDVSADEIAQYLDHSRRYVLVNYLNPMVEVGELVRKYPDARSTPRRRIGPLPRRDENDHDT